MNIIYKTRTLLIRIGKVLPFVVCFIAAISYFESGIALYNDMYIIYDNAVILNTPVSFFIGDYFEYNIQMLVVLCVISVAINTCFYNKLACMYLGVNLFEKSYFDFELEPYQIYVIIAVNLLASGFFVYKGIKILTNKRS